MWELLIFLGFLLLLYVGVLVWRSIKSMAYGLEELKIPISALLKRGYDGGFLIIRKKMYGTPFVQLRKYIQAPSKFGIELAFPESPWSSIYFSKLKDIYDSKRIAYTIEKEDPQGEMNFLYLNFEKDVVMAHNYVVEILIDVFQMDPKARFYVRLENACVDDVLIDR